MAESVYDRINDYGSVKISLASPNDIRSWSFGEVKKPETINYRTYRAEKDGLFCERIFGPERDWECACGKYKGVKYKGIICDRCGVKVTHSRVRRKRMGHINLAAPIVHIWFFKSMPSRIGNLLDMKTADLEKVVYFQDYVVTDVGETPLKPRQLLTEEEFRNAKEKYGDGFKAEMGAEAIKSLLEKLDLAKLSAELREDLNNTGSKQKIKDLTKRLKIVEQLRNSENRSEWMVMDVIPVIPPDLRPLVLLDSGNFATSDLNDLYRRIINRNNRLKKLVDLNAPEVIIRNEKRMLQQAVDALFDNNRCRRPVLGSSNRPLKSLTDMIKGKQGRFRENLLGKRVDYSARSVIVVGPELKLWQCGLPKKIALELYQPFIIRKLKERGMADTIKSAKKMLERKDEEVWDILEQVIYQHPVLLNRAPTLHRMGIQGFEPVLVEGNAIKIHPLVCKGFNADFDGDQMAVHLPLSIEAQVEVNTLMLSPNNIFSPSNGSPIIGPSQDIVLGIYYMTSAVSGERGNEKCDQPDKKDPGRTAVEFYGQLGPDNRLEMVPLFRNIQEVFMAHQQGKVGTHAKIRVRVAKKRVKEEVRVGDKKEVRVSDVPRNGVITTTVGRVIFNDILPPEMPFYNMTLSQKGTNGVISDCYAILGRAATINLLDAIKVLGFKQSTLAGLSFAASDLRVPVDKEKIIKEADAKAEKITREFEQGAITDSERHGELIDCWTHARETVTTAMVDSLRKDTRDGKPYLNPVFLMMDSGARGSRDQVRQLAGMRGLMAKPSGEIIETPIKSNFREGLNVLEYFSSTHGARKGLADTALKTADSGYLTRKLADVAQNVIINELDCGTLAGITKNAVYKGENKEVTLASMIQGRTSRQSILDPKTDASIVSENQLITRDIAAKIEEELSIDSIRVRSPLTCESPLGVCAKCYGADLSTGKQVEEGLAVGIIAAQSIGEPGTQLTMRTFHIGGTSSVITQQNDITSGDEGVVKFHNVTAVPARGEGKTRLVSLKRNGELIIKRDDGYELERHLVPYGAGILIKDGDKVKKGQKICEWDAHRTPILAESAGYVKFQDVVEGETMRRESRGRSRGADRSAAGTENRVIVEHKGDLHPRIFIEDKNGQRLEFHHLPAKAHLAVQEGDEVRPGDLLAHTPRAATGNQDITGGLPRVTEIFEARKPKDPATMAEDAGSVALPTERRKGKTTILVQTKGPKGDIEHHVPHGRRLLVLASDVVEAGDPLIEGPLVPHDILRIKGEEALQQYLLDEVQKVYRSQKVEINDKHIEIIVSQMLRKVKVEKPGDTKYLPGEVVDKFKFRQTNKDLEKKVKVVDPGDTELAKEQIVTRDELKAANEAVEEKGGRPAGGRRPEKATAKTLLLGITKASLQSESFVSAASFQETTKVLTEAALAGKQDELLGLKENVILGHLIPAGTAFKPHLELAIRGEGEPIEDTRRREAREEEARMPSAPAPEVSVAGAAGGSD